MTNDPADRAPTDDELTALDVVNAAGGVDVFNLAIDDLPEAADQEYLAND